MKKLIKNYTTTIKAQKTIGEIQELLAQNGARGIATEYDESGNIKDLFFKIIVNKRELPFRLPVKTKGVIAALESMNLHGYVKNSQDIAWRICKQWLEAQITLVNLEQAKVEEVFLPYLITENNKTLFETMQDNQFLLPSGNP